MADPDPFTTLGKDYLCGKETTLELDDYADANLIFNRVAADKLDSDIAQLCQKYVDGGHPLTICIRILATLTCEFSFAAHADNRLRAVENIVRILHYEIHKRTHPEPEKFTVFDPDSDDIIKF